jgi:hypothetical protein
MVWRFQRAPAMHVRNTICLVILGVFVYSLSWALALLSKGMEFSSFMIFGVVTIAIMVSLGFAWDRYEARHNRSQP